MNETFRRVTFDIKEVLINVSGGYDGDFEKVPFRYKVGQSRQDNVKMKSSRSIQNRAGATPSSQGL